MKELKVEERVTITLEVVERQEGCDGCFFNQGENIPCTYNYKCNRCTRSDHKNVIFKQVKQNMLREDLRGICHRPCIYNDEGKCDMWDELSVPDETEKCDNQQKF